MEEMKKKLITKFEFSVLAAFRDIDQFSHGKLNTDNLRTWIHNFYPKVIDEDLWLFVKYYDCDNDGALSYREFANSLQPCTSYKQEDF